MPVYFDWEKLAQGYTSIGPREVFEGLHDYFPISEVEQFMLDLAEYGTVQFYIGNSGYQVSSMQHSLDFYTVS